MYAKAAGRFQAQGYDMVALATGEKPGDFEEEFVRKGIQIIHHPIPGGRQSPLFYAGYLKGLLRIIREENVDVIHIHRASHLLLFSLSGRISGKKVLRTVHNVFKSRTWTYPKGWLDRLIARTVLGVTFQTIGEGVYKNELTYYKNKSVKINNWYDGNLFFPGDRREKSDKRKALNIPGHKYVIISVGACTAIKNHHDIIRALAHVNQGGEFFYVHLGSGPTECQEKELAGADPSLMENIFFGGNTPHVRDYLVASDLFVMTSRFEGLPISGIEAMACGIPLLFYDAPGLRDLIHDNDCGLLIGRDVSTLAASMRYARDHREEMDAKAAAGFQKAVRDYSMDRNVMDIVKLYQQ